MAQDIDHVTPFNPGRVAAGVIVLGMGLLMWFDRAVAFDVDTGRLFAPFVLIAVGLARLADGWLCRGRSGRHRFAGVWLIAIGGWMLVSTLHVWDLTYHTSWPLLIVVFGILMVARELVAPRRGDRLVRRKD